MPVKSQMSLPIRLINGTSKNKSKCLNANTTFSVIWALGSGFGA